MKYRDDGQLWRADVSGFFSFGKQNLVHHVFITDSVILYKAACLISHSSHLLPHKRLIPEPSSSAVLTRRTACRPERPLQHQRETGLPAIKTHPRWYSDAREHRQWGSSGAQGWVAGHSQRFSSCSSRVCVPRELKPNCGSSAAWWKYRLSCNLNK